MQTVACPVKRGALHQQTGRYEGVLRWTANLGTNVASGLLVWLSALPEQEPAAATGTTGTGFGSGTTTPGGGKQSEPGDTKAGKPRRFYGSISLDPDKAGLQVAKIAEEILFELGRPNGANLRLTLEIEASAPDGYPDDVVDVVRANIRDLRLDAGKVGFEDD